MEALRCAAFHRTLLHPMMARFTLVLVLASIAQVFAQPSPDVQKRISAAIAAAANASTIDYTEFVNPFIGTGRPFLSLHASFSALAVRVV